MTMTITENTAAPDFGAEVAAEQVDYPRILYVCEHCQENAPEMCGRSRDDLYVTPSGKWLCDECIDEEGVPISDCAPPPALYPASTVARLQQEIQRLKAAELAEVKGENEQLRLARPYDGWLYFNPDTGTEWAEQHPVESGEVPDAQSIRPATATNFQNELILAWEDLAKEKTLRAHAEAALAEARKALDLFEHYGCPICHGDCASANPPVDCCPMEAARRAREGGKVDG